MKRIIYTLCLATLLFPLGRMASGQINENKVVEPFVLPKNLIFVEVGGPACNALLFNYQRIIPITESAALTARVGVFGFGNSQPGGAEAQLDAAAGLGLLLSTQTSITWKLRRRTIAIWPVKKITAIAIRIDICSQQDTGFNLVKRARDLVCG